MSNSPELGQAIFGNPTGSFGTPEYVDAFVSYIISEIERVYWNKNQKEWDRYCDPELEGVEFRPYYWGDNEEEAAKPNLKFSSDDQEIRWYKHIGRGQSSSLDYDEKDWIKWFDKALEVVRANEKDPWD